MIDMNPLPGIMRIFLWRKIAKQEFRLIGLRCDQAVFQRKSAGVREDRKRAAISRGMRCI